MMAGSAPGQLAQFRFRPNALSIRETMVGPQIMMPVDSGSGNGGNAEPCEVGPSVARRQPPHAGAMRKGPPPLGLLNSTSSLTSGEE